MSKFTKEQLRILSIAGIAGAKVGRKLRRAIEWMLKYEKLKAQASLYGIETFENESPSSIQYRIDKFMAGTNE